LPEILELLLDMGGWGMGAPVEMEFASTLSVAEGRPKEFSLLQLRPLGLHKDTDHYDLGEYAPEALLCKSDQVMGHGVTDTIRDIVLVDKDRFERACSVEAAEEVARFNEKLRGLGRPYLLIGVGRWGSLDPWLGIPVKWDQISGAKIIVEAGFRDMDVDPSQGLHFFHNLTAFRVSYFTVNPMTSDGYIDWGWLGRRPVEEQKRFVRHIRLEKPFTAKINGHQNRGIILKPE